MNNNRPKADAPLIEDDPEDTVHAVSENGIPEQRRPLTPEAQRALAEAEERRRANTTEDGQAKELGGRDGPDPVRYGDWENSGIASDF